MVVLSQRDSDVTQGAETLLERIAVSEVIVIGGDIVIGQALEILLRSAERSVRFLAELSPSNLGTLEGAKLLLLAPDSNAEHRESLMVLIRAAPDAAQIPTLELVDNSIKAREGAGFVPWPCRIADLKERIEEVLLSRDGESESRKEDGNIIEEREQPKPKTHHYLALPDKTPLPARNETNNETQEVSDGTCADRDR